MPTIRYWAAAREAAGCEFEQVSGTTLAEALSDARAKHPGNTMFARVLAGCSFLVDDTPAGTRPAESVEVNDQSRIEVLPPFAGG